EAGGGIAAFNSTLFLKGTTVESNSTPVIGGGIYSGGGDLIITSSLIANNACTGTKAGFGGGGIYADEVQVTIGHSEIAGNTATQFGAGLFMKGGTLKVGASTFNNNTARTDGGALYLHGAAAALADVTLSGNGAEYGAGIFNVNDSPASDTQLQHDTIAFNAAGARGGGIFSLRGIMDISNTVVAKNTAGELYPDVLEGAMGGMLDRGNNFIGDSTGSAFVAGTPNTRNSFVGTGTSPLDPLLDPLADNGGTTALPDGTHVRTLQNEANSGSNGVRDRGSTGTGLDERGFPVPIHGAADIGAAEFQDFDVAVRLRAPSGRVRTHQPATFTVTVTNLGPNTSRGVTAAVTLPPGTTIVSASVPFTASGTMVTLAVQDLAAGASTTLTLTIVLTQARRISATVALSTHDDANPGNNTASVGVTVRPRVALVTGSTDVTRFVRLKLQGSHQPRKQLTYRLTNAGHTAIQGPLRLVVLGLPHGARLLHAAGRTAAGKPFVLVNVGADRILDPGESTLVRLRFSKAVRPPQLRVLAGGAVKPGAPT